MTGAKCREDRRKQGQEHGWRLVLLPQRLAWVQGERRMDDNQGKKHRERSCLMASGISGMWETSLKEIGLVGGLGKGLGKPGSERPEINPGKEFKGSSGSHEAHTELPRSLPGGSSGLRSVAVFGQC